MCIITEIFSNFAPTTIVLSEFQTNMGNLPNITKNLLIINALAFIMMYIVKGSMGIDLNNVFGLHFFMASDFQVYQLVTYMFMHAGIEHIAFNMLALWMFGRVVETVWGPRKFLFYYIFCGIGAGVMQEIAQFFWLYSTLNSQLSLGVFDAFSVMSQMSEQLNGLTTVGASGAIYAILLAFGMIFPEERIFIFPLPIPIKAKWFVIFYAGVELFSALATPGDHVAHLAHLGGMLFGFLLIRYWRKSISGHYGGRSRGQEFFDKMRTSWEKRSRKQSGPTDNSGSYNRHGSDWDYNSRKKSQQEEVDRILDKIRKSGYESLTREEKQTLFDQSGK